MWPVRGVQLSPRTAKEKEQMAHKTRSTARRMVGVRVGVVRALRERVAGGELGK